jgi:hypothetical protein
MLAGSPAAFGGLIAAETETWAKAAKFSGAPAEDFIARLQERA